MAVPTVIDSFTGDYFFLSNFYMESPLWHKSDQFKQLFKSSEHAFVYFKSLEPFYRASIMDAATPGEAKRLGRVCRLRPDWEQIKERVMFDVLWSKFFPGSVLSNRLLETGSALLVEGNTWGDNEWGSRIDKVLVSEDDDGYEVRRTYRRVYPGKNKLGKILMSIRDLQK